jgi:hypothetical protein
MEGHAGQRGDPEAVARRYRGRDPEAAQEVSTVDDMAALLGEFGTRWMCCWRDYADGRVLVATPRPPDSSVLEVAAPDAASLAVALRARELDDARQAKARR